LCGNPVLLVMYPRLRCVMKSAFLACFGTLDMANVACSFYALFLVCFPF
jgi:hypothetical protein